MPLVFEQFNQDIQQWATEARQLIQRQGRADGLIHRADSPSPSDSLARIREGFRQRDGQVVRVSFKFPRSLVYPMKGAGKGRGGSKGSRWINSKGEQKTTNPASLGKQGTGGRVAKPFLNTALNGPAGIDRLADIAATQLADVVVSNILVK